MLQIMRMAALGAAGLLLAAGPAPAKTVAERRAELAAVQEQINDADPLTRLSFLEAIVESGDPLKIELGVKAAMALDDPMMRGLAMRAYVASVRQIVFDWLYPEPMQTAFERAKSDERQLADFREKNASTLRSMSAVSGKITIRFHEFDLKSASFKAYSPVLAKRYDLDTGAEGQVIGEKLVLRAPLFNSRTDCNVEIAPTPALELIGTMNCDGWSLTQPLRARMF